MRMKFEAMRGMAQVEKKVQDRPQEGKKDKNRRTKKGP
jgi:hypothetical protein